MIKTWRQMWEEDKLSAILFPIMLALIATCLGLIPVALIQELSRSHC